MRNAPAPQPYYVDLEDAGGERINAGVLVMRIVPYAGLLISHEGLWRVEAVTVHPLRSRSAPQYFTVTVTDVSEGAPE